MVSISSEPKGMLAKEIVGEDFNAEQLHSQRDKDEFREVPFVYRPNLIAAIAIQLINMNGI